MTSGTRVRTEIRFHYADGFPLQSYWMDTSEAVDESLTIPAPARITAVEVRQVPIDEPHGADTETGAIAAAGGNPFLMALNILAKEGLA